MRLRVNVVFTKPNNSPQAILQEIRGTGRAMAPGEAIMGDPDRCAETLKEFVGLGFTHLVVQFPHYLQEDMRVFSREVIPALLADKRRELTSL